MLPLPPFRFKRKHHDYTYLKNPLFLLSHNIYVTTDKKNGLTQKKKILCQICKVATGIYVTTHHPYFVIFSQIKKIGSNSFLLSNISIQ